MMGGTNSSSNSSLTVLRLAGIYGPGRSALDKVDKGMGSSTLSIVKPGHVSSAIHVADVARVTVQVILGRGSSVSVRGSVAQSEPAASDSDVSSRIEVFNLADDEPSDIASVNRFAAELLGVPAPEEITLEEALAQERISVFAAEFYSSCRRVANTKVKQVFGPLEFPDYRVGLRQIRALGMEAAPARGRTQADVVKAAL
eukprot:gnl/TRDRNA2_/TRDRNA2_62571_c0_seq1.p1 gnl/TRDRNA2_/TRDRNA2_62571_c0~~gnl/TRDRNA2_/TRDRNA2_62571_c0_seq1.p1  ORF type:complete len:214 (-),score=22.18 gnl/TRDRNA2_/TRDRNA2_62571_c0_seq1:277-876(-)